MYAKGVALDAIIIAGYNHDNGRSGISTQIVNHLSKGFVTFLYLIKDTWYKCLRILDRFRWEVFKKYL